VGSTDRNNADKRRRFALCCRAAHGAVPVDRHTGGAKAASRSSRRLWAAAITAHHHLFDHVNHPELCFTGFLRLVKHSSGWFT
jgi:hypothetical protein